MFAQIKYLENLGKDELDDYLEKGWFRMKQYIFTTNFLAFNLRYYSALWLRVGLRDLNPDKTMANTTKQNAKFRCEVGPLKLTKEKHELYDRYKDSVRFSPSSSLVELLFTTPYDENVFDTREIRLFDGKKLIGLGFFDLGGKSAMGISSFYDPEYKSFSIGKFLIFKKMEWCRDNGLEWFYPGYFAPNYPAFDYKLTIGRPNIEFLDFSSQKWRNIAEFSPKFVIYDRMVEKLQSVSDLLAAKKFDWPVMTYEFFDIRLNVNLQEQGFLDFPTFIFCKDISTDYEVFVIIFSPSVQRYFFVRCLVEWESALESPEPSHFCSHILRPETVLFSSPDSKEFCDWIMQKIKEN